MKSHLILSFLGALSLSSQAAVIVWGNAFNLEPSDGAGSNAASQTLVLNSFDSSRNGGVSAPGPIASTVATRYSTAETTNPLIINGLSFTLDSGNSDFWGYSGINPAMDTLLSGQRTTVGGLFTLTLNGLTPGNLYQIQLIGVHDSRTGSSINQRAYQVDNGAGDYTGAPVLTRGAYGNDAVAGVLGFGTVVGTFTADSTTQTILLRSDQSDGNLTDDVDPGLAGYVLIGVPEPSTVLLGGIGLLALLRRRR